MSFGEGNMREKVRQLELEVEYRKLHTDCWADKCKELEAELESLRLEAHAWPTMSQYEQLKRDLAECDENRIEYKSQRDYLERENAELREYVVKLESLLRDIRDAECFNCDPWQPGFKCECFDGDCAVMERIDALGIEVDE